VAGPSGCFLIEFKGYEGRISGGARDLLATSGSRRTAFDHPKPLLKYKLDKLVEALKQTKPYRTKGTRPPFIEPLVFMHHADSLEIAAPGHIGVLWSELLLQVQVADSGHLGEAPNLGLQLGAGRRKFDRGNSELIASPIRDQDLAVAVDHLSARRLDPYLGDSIVVRLLEVVISIQDLELPQPEYTDRKEDYRQPCEHRHPDCEP
jgi:hypothetical protein